MVYLLNLLGKLKNFLKYNFFILFLDFIMNNKICFVSTYIGNIDLLDISDNFKINNKYDYYFFTNLKKHNIPNNSWKHVRINMNDFSNYKNNVFISRYYKFMLHEVFNKLNKDYDFVFYCDSFLSPKYDQNWDQIVNDCLNTDFPIIQYNHNYSKSIIDEMLAIIKCNKDTVQNMEKLKNYLESIQNEVNINKKQFYENTVLGYSLKNKKVLEFLNSFWNYYINNNNPSYRDQCLWNFIYLKYKYKAYIVKHFKKLYFDGKIKIRRTILDYK